MCRVEMNYDDDEALNSPFSRGYLCPKTEQIINCAVGLRDPIDVDALKEAFSNSVMIKHPRFCSFMVRNHAGEFWRRTHVNIDDHFIIHHHQPTATTTENRHVDDDVEEAVNAYLADLAVSNPLSENKPLWEVHVLMDLNCIVLRVHHAIGDGMSLMSMLSACFGKKREGALKEDKENGGVIRKTEAKRKWKEVGVWGLLKTVWFTLVFVVKHLAKFIWLKDEKSVIYGGDGLEFWPRKLETVKFQLQDLKSIKKAIPNATINDVLLGVISCGLSKYLQSKSPKALLNGLQVTALQLVNLRKNPGLQEMPDLMTTWGNKTGMQLHPFHFCERLLPLEHVKRMKAIMDQKKQSFEPQIFHIVAQLILSCVGLKVTSWAAYRLACHTTLAISNIMGPSEELAIAGNPITYVRVNVSGPPQALTMHMVSYAGKADLQVMVAKDIISDSQFLAKCFQESLLEMKSYIDDSNKQCAFKRAKSCLV